MPCEGLSNTPMNQFLAAVQTIFGYTCSADPCTLADFFGMLYVVLRFVMITLAPLAVALAVMVGAFYLITSADNPARVQQGKTIIWNAVVGLGVVLGAWVIINTIFMLLGVTLPCGANWYQITSIRC